MIEKLETRDIAAKTAALLVVPSMFYCYCSLVLVVVILVVVAVVVPVSRRIPWSRVRRVEPYRLVPSISQIAS